MGSLVLYLVILAAGSVAGSKLLKPEKEYRWIGKVQFVAIMILVVAMGIRIGSDDKVISSLADIGVSAFVITVFVLIGSVCAVFLARRYLLRLDKKGVKRGE